MPDDALPYLAEAEQARALAEFLQKHVTPYDPQNDDYERPPFAQDIKEGKNDPIYNAHSYHTKVPPRSIVPYILHYTKPGDVVLDPFCGSGMTGVAAQMCADPPADLLAQFPDLSDRVGPRACILNDLSPAACHIACNYNTPVDVDALRREFERIKAAVKDEFDWLYGTEHYEPAVGLYAPKNSEVLARLKNPPRGAVTGQLLDGVERTWELLTRDEVESRLGYPVTELPRDKSWGELDVAKVAEWVCIPATIQYTIWSDVYRCEGFVTIEEPTGKISTRGKNAGKPMVRKKRVARGCGNEIVLWDAAVKPEEASVATEFLCPNCRLNWTKTSVPRISTIPVVTSYEFLQLRRASSTETKLKTTRLSRRLSSCEAQRIHEVSATECPYWQPSTAFDPEGPQYRRNALANRRIAKVTDFYTSRNLRAIACLWEAASKAEKIRVRSFLQFVITAIMHQGSRRNAWPIQKAMTGTLYIPSISIEQHFLGQVERKFEVALLPRANSTAIEFPVVLCGSATGLSRIPTASIDYVFTDPPFGSNIYYSEMNLMLEAWVGIATDSAKEAVVHRKNDGGSKRLPDYALLMHLAFAEIFRVLKPGRWATVEFNNSDGSVFEAIKEAIREAGFEIVNMLLLDKEQKTFKQVKGAEGVEDVVDKDVLFNLHKPAVVRHESQSHDHDLEHQVADAVREHLVSLPARIAAEPAKYSDEHRTTATINSMLMNALIPRGVSVEQLNLPFIERVCSRYFRKIGQRWYLRGEAAGGNGGGGLFEEEVAIRDSLSAIDWLRQKLRARPMLVGELKPLWMRAVGLLPADVSQTLDLDDLLGENFWRDEDTNRWREPTAQERERMNDDRSARVLHDAERYLSGSLRRPTTDAERADWVDVLFQACRQVAEGDLHATPALRGFDVDDGHRLITRLFQSILSDHVSAEVFARAKKQAAVASSRISQVVRAEQEKCAAEHKRKKLPLFD